MPALEKPTMTAVAPTPLDARTRARPLRRIAKAGNLHSPALQRTYRWGLVLLGVQLVGFLVWSAVQASRAALTWDFSQYLQAWALIAHGHLDPVDTMEQIPFWKVHGDVSLWPMAVFWYVWPHPVTLLWLQDFALVGAEAVGFRWTCELLDQRGSRHAAPLGAGVVALYLLNPWMLWSVAFDYHTEILGVLLALLTARDLFHGRHRAYLFAGLLLLTGNVGATYLFAVAVAHVLSRRRPIGRGVILAVLGVVWLIGINVVHADLGGGLGGYAYLLSESAAKAAEHPPRVTTLIAGIGRHPTLALAQLRAHLLGIWGDVGASGPLGMLSLLVLPFPLVTLIVNGLQQPVAFVAANFQNVPVYAMVPIGCALVLGRLLGSSRRRAQFLAFVLVGVTLVLSAGFAATWFPRTASQWLRVSPAAASVLHHAQSEIGPRDEVVASQGVAGTFAARAEMFTALGPGTIPVRARVVDFVIAPRLGIETQSVGSADAWLARVARLPGTRLVAAGAGIWVIRWVPRGEKSIAIPAGGDTLPAWVAAGAAGHADLSAAPPSWSVRASGARGYVVAGDYWQATRTGTYRGSVRLSAGGPVSVELWDATANVLLARRMVPGTAGVPDSVTVEGRLNKIRGQRLFSGVGPWRAAVNPSPAGDSLELRVWSPGKVTVRVSSISLTRVGSKGTSALPS